MDQKLTAQNFTNIFKDSVPNIVSQIPAKAFNACVKDYSLPYLNSEEKACVKDLTQKYMYSMDFSLLYFSKKLI